MTLSFRGDNRTPGPIGSFFGDTGARAPGPLGTLLWDKQTAQPAPSATAAPSKSTIMPLPTMHDSVSKDVHVVTWPLYAGTLDYTQVRQSPFIANCPVAAILAAMSFNADGRTAIQRKITETAANVSTDVSNVMKQAALTKTEILSNPPPGNVLKSARYFTVMLASGPLDVSDVLYTDDHDSGWTPLYLRDPDDQCIWPSIIEKALAVQFDGYENFDAIDTKVNAFWKQITGFDPGGQKIDDKTSLERITEIARNSVGTPTVAASKPDSKDVSFVSEFHGFAMKGLDGSKILLYDAMKGVPLLRLSPAEFRHDFQAVYYPK